MLTFLEMPKGLKLLFIHPGFYLPGKVVSCKKLYFVKLYFARSCICEVVFCRQKIRCEIEPTLPSPIVCFWYLLVATNFISSRDRIGKIISSPMCRKQFWWQRAIHFIMLENIDLRANHLQPCRRSCRVTFTSPLALFLLQNLPLLPFAETKASRFSAFV